MRSHVFSIDSDERSHSRHRQPSRPRLDLEELDNDVILIGSRTKCPIAQK